MHRTTITIFMVTMLVSGSQTLAERYYVNATVTAGADDGASWDDAFADLQNALGVAQSGDDVWIATGTYVPTATADRAVSFVPAGGVTLYGGFAGHESALAQRDWHAHPTVLSGDLSGDDSPAFTNRSDNAYHVVRIAAQNVVLDGVVIRGGMATDEPGTFGPGGGMVVESDQSVAARHCQFTDNEAQRGGAVAVEVGSGTFEQCRFEGNRAIAAGGTGGAVHIDIDIVGLNEVVFTNCLVNGNVANSGGGIAASYSQFTLNNCTVVANTALQSPTGAGVQLTGATGFATIHNTIIWGNVDSGGAPSDLTQLWTPMGFLFMDRTCVQDYAGSIPSAGTGNTGDDPLFIDALGPDGTPGTGDEDHRLSAASPLIDRGDNASVPAHIVTDLNGGPRFVDDPNTPDTGSGSPPLVDLGAFEFGAGGIPALGGSGLAVCAGLLLVVAIVVIRKRAADSRTA